MSKGLEKLKTIRHIHDMECGKDQAIDNDFDIIEKELKEHEKDKKMLEIFKNALTIEHHEIPLELINSSDIHEFISGITKQITTIKENELDKKLRKSLREWVLKNAFPKELKALEIIKGFRKDKYSKMEIDGNDIIINAYLTLDDDEIDLLKEVME